MSFRRAALVSIFVATSTGGVAAPATAGCALPEDRADFRRALRDTMVCASRRLRSSRPTDCSIAPPPTCGADHFDRVLELLGGMPSGPASSPDQIRCQVAAYRGASRFLERRLVERVAGRRRQRRSNAALRRLQRRCTLRIEEDDAGPLPRFGGRCSALHDTPAQLLAGDRVQQCLRPALEEIANSLYELPPIPPNVVLVVTDDQPPEGINLMPSVLDLAQQGVSFTNAFTTTPICGAARAGILTGQHATTHGVISNGWSDTPGTFTWGAAALDDSSTLATWFQAAGYRTALIGKHLNGYFTFSPAIPPGWDEWRVFDRDTNNFFDYGLNENGVVREYGNDPADYSTDILAQATLHFAEDNADTPFFLMFTPFAPHEPSTPAPRHLGSLSAMPPWRPPSWGEDISDKPNWIRFFASSPAALLANDEEIAKERESLLAVDEAVEAIVSRLEDLGLTDNTIFVFTTDHGIQRGEHRLLDKQLPYEESIRIPLVIRYPLQLPAGEARAELALNIDIAPTLTSLAEIEATHRMDGRSLTELLDGALNWRNDFIAQHFIGGFTFPPWDMIRTERYKYVRHPNDLEELYDLASDEYELDNIAGLAEHAALKAALAARLDELIVPRIPPAAGNATDLR